MHKLAGAVVLAFLANLAYVAAFAFPTVFYMLNVLGHLVLGVAAGALAWRAFSGGALGSRPRSGFAAFILSGGLGLVLAWRGNTSDMSPVLAAHIVTGALSLAATLVWIARARRAGFVATRFAVSFAGLALAAVALPTGAVLWRTADPDPSGRIVNPSSPPITMEQEGGGTASPFFPSSARTNVGGTIPSEFFLDSEACAECHKDIYDQWNGSAHHFASFNNQFYRKSIEYMQSVVGTQPSKWCAGCHDHALFFNGRFDTPVVQQIDTREAQAGLACTSCHAITAVEGTMGQGGFTIAYPPLHELLSSRNRVVRGIDRFLTYLDPEPHRKTFMKPFMRQDSSEFCAACHKVHLDVPVNQYRWFRGFNDYDAWQASAVSGQGARSFYYPEKPSTCVDCHMPLVPSRDAGHQDGKVNSHRFPAANTALPFVNHDTAQLKATTDFLTSGFVSVDIFAAAPADAQPSTPAAGPGGTMVPMTTFAVGEEADAGTGGFMRQVGNVLAPLDQPGALLPRGRDVRIDVVVRTRRIGHFFPGGTVDAFDVWLELQARDATGRPFFWSGSVEDDGKGPVESGAHFYKSAQLDADGNAVNKRNAWQTRSMLYVRLIPPGAADTAHFRVRIPEDAQGPVTFTARLNHRKFSHYYTQFAYAGVPKPGQPASLLSAHANGLEYDFDPSNIPANVSGAIKNEIPVLPIVTLAEASATVGLAAADADGTWRVLADKRSRERWNDWGIGLLLQGHLQGAVYAFRRVTEAEPEYADGWLNVARALIQSGDTDGAKPYLQEALRRNETLGRIHYFNALVQRADGDFDGARASLDRVLVQYPRDRVVLNQLARLHFLERRYREALDVLARVAAVDPEDLQMHYTAMLAHRGLGDEAAAERSEQLFLRFKADESSTAITGPRRLAHPEENNERHPYHEHGSAPLDARGPRR